MLRIVDLNILIRYFHEKFEFRILKEKEMKDFYVIKFSV